MWYNRLNVKQSRGEAPPCEPRQQQMLEWQRSLILSQEKAASEVSWRNCQQNPPSIIEKDPPVWSTSDARHGASLPLGKLCSERACGPTQIWTYLCCLLWRLQALVQPPELSVSGPLDNFTMQILWSLLQRWESKSHGVQWSCLVSGRSRIQTQSAVKPGVSLPWHSSHYTRSWGGLSAGPACGKQRLWKEWWVKDPGDTAPGWVFSQTSTS